LVDAAKTVLKEVLRPISFCYGLGAYARLLSYSKGLSSRRSAAVPVISVGNITVGGTGKTPITIDLAERFASAGLKVAILSRGYGRKSKGLLVVSDGGGKPLVSVEDAGDEPYLMAQSVSDAIVIVCSSRVESAQEAVRKYGAQIIILDDGFQHIKLRRDIDCVLWDFNDKPADAMIVPSGRLREPLGGLRRASTIVVTKVPADTDTGTGFDTAIDTGTGANADEKTKAKNECEAERILAEMARIAPQADLYSCRFVPSYLTGYIGAADLEGENTLAQALKLTELKGKRVYALSAIARPEGFLRELKSLGAQIVRERAFSDHHWFSPAQISEMEADFVASGADLLVTTEKDLVRLKLPASLAARTFAVVLKCQWLPGPPAFVAEMITAMVKSSG
jgi:tetraacyldisaccharide-1-P 4'-kinase